MVFSSLIFIFWFLPVVLAVYFLLKPNYRNYWLTLASLFFYSWGELKYSFVLLLSIIVNYFLGLLVGNQKLQKYRILFLTIGIVSNLSLLGYFKYWNFILDNIFRLIPNQNFENNLIHLPIGISFFTFQIITYLVDVYQGKHKPLTNIFELALYKSFFPQLIAGPVVAFHDFVDQIHCRIVTLEMFTYGIKRFTIGLAKKVLIANNVSIVADSIFGLSNIPADLAWLGIIAYSIQIYFDFSGYSDMAIGMAAMFGFKFNENFNYPYASKSIQEFWRRWHISLSSWFRDYLYIPLGGNQVAKWRFCLNIIIVFSLTGLWHGANWNFLIWGLLNGCFLLVEQTFFGKILRSLPAFLNHLYLLLVVTVGWVFFRTNSLSEALLYLMSLFGYYGFSSEKIIFNSYINNEQLLALAIGIIFAYPVFPYIERQILKLFVSTKKSYQLASLLLQICVLKVLPMILFFLSVGYLIVSSHNPFIYFRF